MSASDCQRSTIQKRLCRRPLRVISRSRDTHLSSQTSAAWYSGVCSYVAGDFWVFRGVMRALWSCERGSEIVDGRRRPAMPRSWRSWRRAAATTAGHSHCCSWRCRSRHRSSVDSTTVGAACPWQIQPRYPPTPAVTPTVWACSLVINTLMTTAAIWVQI